MITIFFLILAAALAVESVLLRRIFRQTRLLRNDCDKLRIQMRDSRRCILDHLNLSRTAVMRAQGNPVIRVRVLPMDETIVLMHPNISLLNSAWENGIGIPTACLGNARCGTCKVRVVEPKGRLPAKAAQEKITLSMFTRDEDIRLSCMIKPKEDMVVKIESEQELIDTILPPLSPTDRVAAAPYY